MVRILDYALWQHRGKFPTLQVQEPVGECVHVLLYCSLQGP